MPDLLGELSGKVYGNCPQNCRIPGSMCLGTVMLLRKVSNKRNIVDNFRSVTLLNTDYKILAKLLAKRLVLVADRLVGDTQTCINPSRTIHDNLHLTRYRIVTVVKEPGSTISTWML